MKVRIKNKIVIMNMAVLIPVLIFICAITVNSLYNNVIKSSINMLKQESYNSQLNIINYLESDKKMDVGTLFKNISPFIATNLSERYKFRIQIYNNEGILGDSEEYPSISEDRDVKTALLGTKSYILKKINNKRYILFSSPIYIENETIGCIRYIYHIDKEMDLIINTLITMLILGIFALFFSIFLSNIFSEKIVSPIMQLKEAAEKVSNGDFTNIEEIDSEDEITDLAKSFNIMSDNISLHILRLKEEKNNQKRFLDNVTHELKTPITSIIGYSDLLPRVKTEEDRMQCCNYINKGGQRLLCMVEELLKLSKLNKDDFEIERENLNIRDIIQESISILKPRLEKGKIDIKANLFDCILYIDEQKTEQVILNIIDNAIKYSECSFINIEMSIVKKNLIVSIKDDGRGIPKEHLEKIFEPFYTAHKNLQNQYGGMGLGLSICKEIMQKQQGDIFITSKFGTEVELNFKMLQF